jgi:hypothetical protein
VSDDDVDFDNLDCRLFVDGAADRAELTGWIAAAVGGDVTEDGVAAGGLEIFVDDNEDAGAEVKTSRDDGFLYFDHTAEVYFARAADQERRIRVVTDVLESLWDSDLPAVAACDYEDSLPRGAGRAESAPWPSDD